MRHGVKRGFKNSLKKRYMVDPNFLHGKHKELVDLKIF